MDEPAPSFMSLDRFDRSDHALHALKSARCGVDGLFSNSISSCFTAALLNISSNSDTHAGTFSSKAVMQVVESAMARCMGIDEKQVVHASKGVKGPRASIVS